MVKPRPVIVLASSYGAGLATGLLHFGVPVGVSLVLVAVICWRPFALAHVLVAGFLLGQLSGSVASARARNHCAALLPAGEIELRVRLLEPARRLGGPTEVRPIVSRCHGAVRARWPSGEVAEAGREATVRARWIPPRDAPSMPGRGGTLLVSRVDDLGGQARWPERLRTWTVLSIHRLYGSRAPIVDMLILDRRGEVDRALLDQYAKSGLVHLLSISGFHVGLIVAWVFLLCRTARQSRNRSLVIAAMVAVAYVAFLGWPGPATRAAGLAALLAFCYIRQRRVTPNALLSVSCLLVMLIDPWAVLDLGAWLSGSALWGATTFTRWSDRALGDAIWWRTLSSSVGATLATAPITAACFGTVAVIGVVLNFAAIPLAAIAVPGVLASILLLPIWPDLAAALAAGSGSALAVLDVLAEVGARVPHGHIVQAMEPGSAFPWLLALSVALWGISARTTRGVALGRWACGAAIASWAILFGALTRVVPDNASGLTLHFLDVGQGDGAAIRTPAGHWVVIDAGPRSERFDAGRRVMVPFLRRYGVRSLEAIIVSHAHADHLGGVPAVLDQVKTGLVLEPGDLVSDELYLEFLDRLAADATPWRLGRAGTHFVLDSVRFTILHPTPAWPGWGEDLNEDSAVLLVEYRSFQALFAGDAGFRAEAYLRSRVGSVDVLKVGHHGSRGSTGDPWLEELGPRAAVISVGVNRYGHPSRETLRRLSHRRIPLWRTDRDGTVTVRTDGRSMTVSSERRSEKHFDVR